MLPSIKPPVKYQSSATTPKQQVVREWRTHLAWTSQDSTKLSRSPSSTLPGPFPVFHPVQRSEDGLAIWRVDRWIQVANSEPSRQSPYRLKMNYHLKGGHSTGNHLARVYPTTSYPTEECLLRCSPGRLLAPSPLLGHSLPPPPGRGSHPLDSASAKNIILLSHLAENAMVHPKSPRNVRLLALFRAT